MKAVVALSRHLCAVMAVGLSIGGTSAHAAVLDSASFDGQSFLLLSAADWYQAEAEAVKLHGNLVTISSAQENAFLWSLWGPTYHSLWIGFSDTAHKGTYAWVDGSPVTYTNWAPGQPDDYQGIQDYGYMTDLSFVTSVPGTWDDSPPNFLPAIVEVSPIPEPSTALLLMIGVAGMGIQRLRSRKTRH